MQWDCLAQFVAFPVILKISSVELRSLGVWALQAFSLQFEEVIHPCVSLPSIFSKDQLPREAAIGIIVNLVSSCELPPIIMLMATPSRAVKRISKEAWSFCGNIRRADFDSQS